MPALHIRRIRLNVIETFKILYTFSPAYLHDLISYKEFTYSFRYDNLVEVPRVLLQDSLNLQFATRPQGCGTASRMN